MDNPRKKRDTLLGAIIVFSPTVAFFVVALRGDDPVDWLSKMIAMATAYTIMSAVFLVVMLMLLSGIRKLLHR
jgi:hypothetical protein